MVIRSGHHHTSRQLMIPTYNTSSLSRPHTTSQPSQSPPGPSNSWEARQKALEENWHAEQQKRQQEVLEWQSRMKGHSSSTARSQNSGEVSPPADDLNSRFQRMNIQSSTIRRRCSDDVLRPGDSHMATEPLDDFDMEHGSELNFVFKDMHLSQPERRPFMPYIY
eukprot:543970_1